MIEQTGGIKLVKKDLTGNIIKGLATIMVVIGHSWEWMTPYVYTCHLALFFFVAGFHYNEEKYSGSPVSLLSKRIVSEWPKFFMYNILFVLVHNYFIAIGFYSANIPIYSSKDIFQNIFSILAFQSSEQMGGAMWFVPMFIINMGIFNALFYLVNKYCKRKRLSLSILFCVVGIAAMYIEFVGVQLPYLYHLGIKYLPISFLGVLLSKNKVNIMKYITIPGTSIALFLLWFLIDYKGVSNVYMTGNLRFIFLYYPITFLGTYITMALTKVIKLFRKFEEIVVKIGEHSFDIMALHFLMFKIVDYVYNLLSHSAYNELEIFPTSYPELWPIYILFGTFAPIIVVSFYKKIRTLMNN